ncbi:hypothetical protein BCY86_09005 [Pajaroellobacter abortibovis]|uniref:Uncharacterized protein n=1 Tax=Pajaroellobacter abortibovis TaxID=1882918 RepID=A0A1L6MYY1_9BACT|nr:hypothetical protein BCY86_09005 [Pajaroellobacter abortibovis]
MIAPRYWQTLLPRGISCVALLLFSFGLWIGAKKPLRTAIVLANFPSSEGIAWQVLILEENKGIRQSVALDPLMVEMSWGEEHFIWVGRSNHEGVGELFAPFSTHHDVGEPLFLEVWDGAHQKLASGRAAWKERTTSRSFFPSSKIEPTQTGGEMEIEVVVEGGRLIPYFPIPVWMRLKKGPLVLKDLSHLEVEPEPGLTLADNPDRACSPGWKGWLATVQGGTAALTARVHMQESEGYWFGALPVALAGVYAVIQPVWPQGKKWSTTFFAPSAARRLYTQLYHRGSRLYAAAIDLEATSPDGWKTAQWTTPFSLQEGEYWLVTAPEPERIALSGAYVVARPYWVGPQQTEPVLERSEKLRETSCSLTPDLALSGMAATPSWIALDGFALEIPKQEHRKKVGLLLAWGSLLVGGSSEMTLLAWVWRRRRNDKDHTAPVSSLATGLTLAFLGFFILGVVLWVGQ